MAKSAKGGLGRGFGALLGDSLGEDEELARLVESVRDK